MENFSSNSESQGQQAQRRCGEDTVQQSSVPLPLRIKHNVLNLVFKDESRSQWNNQLEVGAIWDMSGGSGAATMRGTRPGTRASSRTSTMANTRASKARVSTRACNARASNARASNARASRSVASNARASSAVASSETVAVDAAAARSQQEPKRQRAPEEAAAQSQCRNTRRKLNKLASTFGDGDGECDGEGDGPVQTQAEGHDGTSELVAMQSVVGEQPELPDSTGGSTGGPCSELMTPLYFEYEDPEGPFSDEYSGKWSVDEEIEKRQQIKVMAAAGNPPGKQQLQEKAALHADFEFDFSLLDIILLD